MTHRQLWAPWRLAYVAKTELPGQPRSECFLCDDRDASPEHDRDNLVVLRGEHAIVVLNRFPYNNGHLLVAPKAHQGDLLELNDAELLECQHLLQLMLKTLKQIVTPDGFNIGLNLGRVAGAGLPGHLHWHIVPRWNGDTNFMPVLADARVIPQSLDALFELLRQELSESGI